MRLPQVAIEHHRALLALLRSRRNSWRANDEIFGPEGARAFLHDLPDAEIHLLDAGHFALESDFDTVAGYVRGFLGRVVE